jgi:twitching motility two-component system response regulator PilH
MLSNSLTEIASGRNSGIGKPLTEILVIDDNLKARWIIVEILKDAGYTTREAIDGQEGLKLLQTHRPAVVITDIFMPEMDGLEIIRELRRDPCRVAIIAISGGGPNYLDAAKKFGADVILAKPFSPPELIAAIETLTKAA